MMRTTKRLLILASNAPWVTFALVIAASVLFVENRTRLAASTVLTEHLAALANPSSGGVLFVLSPLDCIDARDQVTELATIARDNGLIVRALVIEDGLHPTDLRALLNNANQRFPHYPVPMRTAALVANMFGVGQTPMMLTVNGATGIVGVAALDGSEQLLELALRHEEASG